MAKQKPVKKLLLRLTLIVLLLLILCYNPVSVRLMTLGVGIYYNLDPVKFYRLVKAESSFRSFAVSEKQAIGLGQVQETTAHYVSYKHKKGLLFVPFYNLRIAALYLRYLLHRYEGNWSLALAAYNWGETKVDKRIGNLRVLPAKDYSYLFTDIPETQTYIRRILK